jgi:hypothetical protein
MGHGSSETGTVKCHKWESELWQNPPDRRNYKGSGILGNLFKVQGTITYDTRYPLIPT